MERVSTGIKTFDKLMEGGIPKGFIVEVSGATGTGKTILCTQILVNAIKNGKKGLYVSFDQSTEAIISQAKQFWPEVGKTKNLKVVRSYYAEEIVAKSRQMKATRAAGAEKDLRLLEIIAESKEMQATRAKARMNAVPNALNLLDDEIDSFKPDVVVVDSVSALTDLATAGDAQGRDAVAEIVEFLRSKKVTTLLISELPEDNKTLSKDGMSEFMVDGVIVLYYLGLGAKESRTIAIRKMRETNHGKDVYPMEITSKGIEVKKTDEAYKV